MFQLKKNKTGADESVYCFEKGRFHPDIGNMALEGYTFGPTEPHRLPNFTVDFFHMAEAAFQMLLTGHSAQMTIYTQTGNVEKKDSASISLGDAFLSSYALFLQSHRLYEGRVQQSELPPHLSLTLYFDGGDSAPVATYFSHCRRWLDLACGVWMECSGVLDGADFDRPDLHLFCSDAHPAMTIELSERVDVAVVRHNLEQVCRVRGKALRSL